MLMSRTCVRIVCRFLAVAVIVMGLLPLANIIKQSQTDAHLGYDEEVYLDYNRILSFIILLVSIAAGIILLWLGSHLKSKD